MQRKSPSMVANRKGGKLLAAGRTIEATRSKVGNDRSSQDVMLIEDTDGSVRLANREHVGHQFFKSLAELNRTKFVDSLKRNENGRVAKRIALSILNNICDKGRGKVLVPSGHHGWKDAGVGEEAKMLVYKALNSLFAVNPATNEPTTSSTKRRKSVPSPPPPQSVVSPPSSSKVVLRPLKRGVPAVSGGGTPMITSPRLPKRPRIVSLGLGDGVSPSPALQQQALYDPKALAVLMAGMQQQQHTDPKALLQHQEHSQVSCIPAMMPKKSHFATMKPVSSNSQELGSGNHQDQHALRRNGILTTFSEVLPGDVLCGGSGEAILLNSSHPGNKRFCSFVEAQIPEFIGADKSQQLRLAQLAVAVVNKTAPGGRFLVGNTRTGRWHEVDADKACSKVLRTFQTFTLLRQQQHHLPASLRRDSLVAAAPRPTSPPAAAAAVTAPCVIPTATQNLYNQVLLSRQLEVLHQRRLILEEMMRTANPSSSNNNLAALYNQRCVRKPSLAPSEPQI